LGGAGFANAVFPSEEGDSVRTFEASQVTFRMAASTVDNIWVRWDEDSPSSPLHIDLTATADHSSIKVSSIHSLMNCLYGEADSNIGSITSLFADDSKHTEDIVVGKNVRDYYQGPRYCSTVSDINVTEIMAPSDPTWIRLDMQSWILPTEYHSKILCGIRIHSTGRTHAELIFVAALTATLSP